MHEKCEGKNKKMVKRGEMSLKLEDIYRSSAFIRRTPPK